MLANMYICICTKLQKRVQLKSLVCIDTRNGKNTSNRRVCIAVQGISDFWINSSELVATLVFDGFE